MGNGRRIQIRRFVVTGVWLLCLAATMFVGVAWSWSHFRCETVLIRRERVHFGPIDMAGLQEYTTADTQVRFELTPAGVVCGCTSREWTGQLPSIWVSQHFFPERSTDVHASHWTPSEATSAWDSLQLARNVVLRTFHIRLHRTSGVTSAFGDGLRVGVPYRLPLVVFAPFAVIGAVQRIRRRFRPGHCRKCRYDLTGITDICPECGTLIPVPDGGGRA